MLLKYLSLVIIVNFYIKSSLNVYVYKIMLKVILWLVNLINVYKIMLKVMLWVVNLIIRLYFKCYIYCIFYWINIDSIYFW